SVTTAHLHGFFKVCRYLGVHKRACVTRYHRASEAYRAMGPAPSRYDFGCWFLAHGYLPLFDGEVMSFHDLNLDKADFDTCDRMVTSPRCALIQKGEGLWAR
uniref:hypothetical protein n=1 Tax=uncultured Vibrio sp. TaxID=114054 RepID=UPI00263964D4